MYAANSSVAPNPSRRIHWIFVGIFVLGAALRALDVGRPVNRPDWRECDVCSIARNFEREGMNPLYPRVDWRGDGPGYAEMEAPFYPWTIALLSKVFGHQELVA